MKSYKLSELNQDAVTSLKARPRIDFSSIFGVVSFIHYLSYSGVNYNFTLQFQFKTSDFKFYV